MVKRIILVFKTHFDIGFTDLSRNVVRKYGHEMLRQVMETCNGTAHLGDLRYVWTMPAWPLLYITEHCDPAHKEELDRLIREGQIVWHGLPFTSHTDFSSPEEIADGLRYSRILAERYGKSLPVSAKMTDVPGHGLELPDVLAQGGIRFLHLGSNEFATPPAVPPLFFWQGPGGGRVLTMYSPGGYGSGLLPPKDWPFDTWMALMPTQDNMGPQSADAVTAMARQAKEAIPGVEVVCGSMDQFYQALEKQDLSAIPVVTEDLADTWIHGVGSYPGEIAQIRRCREQARTIHSRYFAYLASGKAPIPELEEAMTAYEDALALFTEHTWGADVKTFLGPNRVYEKEAFRKARREQENYRFMEVSWQEQRERAENARKALERAEELLAAKEEQGLFTDRPYAGWVRLPEAFRGKSVSLDGKPLSVCTVAGKWCCYVPELAPLNPAALTVGDDAPEAELQVSRFGDRVRVENDRYRLTFSGTTGRIMTLFDKGLGDTLLRAGEDQQVFQYQYDRIGMDQISNFLHDYGYRFLPWGIQDYGRENYPICPTENCQPSFTGWRVEGANVVFTYAGGISHQRYGDAADVMLTVTLPPQGDTVFLHLELADKDASPFVESGSLVLPLGWSGHYEIGKPGALVDPAKDIRDCANHTLLNLEQEVTAVGSVAALQVASLDAPLFSVGGSGVYQYYRTFPEHSRPEIWFNLFNNMWGTNFPQWTEGSFTYDFALRGCSPEEADSANRWASTVCRGPALSGTAAAGVVLPEGMEIVHTERKENILYVTLLDRMGQAGERTLKVPGAKLAPADLQNRVAGEAAEGQITFTARPWGLHRFAVCREVTEK